MSEIERLRVWMEKHGFTVWMCHARLAAAEYGYIA